MCSDSRRRLLNLSPSSFPFPHHHGDTRRTGRTTHTTDPGMQNQLSTRSPSPPVDPPPPPTTTKLPKIAAPTLFTGLQDDLHPFKVECTLYICLRRPKFP